MSCRAPVLPLDALIEVWPAGQAIHVIHDTAFAPESFNIVLFGDRAGTALSGTRLSGPLRIDDALRQAVIALALRVGIEVE